MKSAIAEYGLLIIAVILVASVFWGVIPMFQDGGTIKNSVLDYVTNLC